MLNKRISTIYLLFIILINSIFFTNISYSYLIPDTGQTASDNQEPGEDSYYNINPQDYTKFDSTGKELLSSALSWSIVRDNVTGLYWEIKTGDDSIHGKNKTFTWYDSNLTTNGGYEGTSGAGTDTEDFISELNTSNFGGFSDWRLPSLKELASIVQLCNASAAISSSFFPETSAQNYWSSTTYSGVTTKAWAVNFNVGKSNYLDKSEAVYVRAVRGVKASSQNRFISNGDGTVTDTLTGLMWDNTDLGKKYLWLDAVRFCHNLSKGGYSDWRLPNREELRSILNYSNYAPSSYSDFFPGTISNNYWSSSLYSFNTDYAWCITFQNGYDNYKSKNNSYYLRPVRGGQIINSGAVIIESPSPTSIWYVDRVMQIKWNTQGISGNVRISINRIGQDEVIAESTENDGYYEWTISGEGSVNCTLNITPINEPLLKSSVGLFTIKPNDLPILSVVPTSKTVSLLNGNVSFDINNIGQGTMNWTASTNNIFWFSIIGDSSGVNSGILTVSYLANSDIGREGFITVSAENTINSPQTIKIIQEPGHCAIALSPSSKNVSSSSGVIAISVTNAGTTQMDWTAVSNSDWITITSAKSGTNDGIVSIIYGKNGGDKRTGSVSIISEDAINSPQTFELSQNAGYPILSVSPTLINIPAAGSENNITVTNIGAGTMIWNAASNNDWIIIKSGYSGSNSGVVKVLCYQNEGNQRTGSVTISTASDSITVQIVQSSANPILSVTPLSKTVSSSSGSTSFTIANSGSGSLLWSANITSDWLSFQSDNAGTGSGIITVSYEENTGNLRSGTIVITALDAQNSPQTIEIIQEKKSVIQVPEWSIDPRNYQYQCMLTLTVYDDNGQTMANSEDMLAAFVDGICRGVTYPTSTSFGSRYFLQVWSNKNIGEVVTFKYFNSKTGNIYNINEKSIVFQANAAFGSINEPLNLVSKAVDLIISLKQGWNWITINVLNSDMRIDTVLNSIKGNCELIVGQNGFSQFYAGKWYGLINEINPTQMYMLKMYVSDTFQYLGDPIEVSNTKISVSSGWNWIGYIPYVELNINDALTSIGYNGLYIVGQSGYAEFYSSWWGSLTKLEPNKGYQIKMASDAVLIYPTSASKSIYQNNSLIKNKKTNNIFSKYQYQETIIASVVNTNNKSINNINDEITVFSGDELRAKAKPVSTCFGNLFFIQVWGNNNSEKLSFKYYNYNNDIIYNISEKQIFESYSTQGKIDSPIIFHIDSISNDLKIINCISNCNNEKYSLYDAISIIQILAGLNSTQFDNCENNKIDLKKAIEILKCLINQNGRK